MKLTAPIHILKQRAKLLKKADNIPLNVALNQIAKTQGYSSWSLLQNKAVTSRTNSAIEIYNSLKASDMLLIGARPNLGKTKLALEILLQSVKHKRVAYFYSLEYTRSQTLEKLQAIDPNYLHDDDLLRLNFSDEIGDEYIINKCQADSMRNSVIVIDYLQLLDQKRHKPELQVQVKRLKTFADETGCIMVFISQIDRMFEQNNQAKPNGQDVRLPNPLDLSLFNKTVFI